VLDALREPLRLRCDADRDNRLRVVSLTVDEQLGQPWTAQVEAVQSAGSPALDPEGLLGSAASLSVLRTTTDNRAWDGIITACRRQPAQTSWRRWLLVIEHPLALRRLDTRSRLVRDRHAAALAGEVLGDRAHPVRQDLRQPPPSREQLTQWRESDLAWCQRLLEHDGISLVCDGAGILLTDHAAGFPRLEQALPWIPPAANASPSIDPARQPSLRAWSRQLHAVPGSAAVRDWNWRNPQEPIARAAAAGGLVGESRQDGSHHRDGGEANRLAGIRAEELRCTRETWHGEADHPALSAGRVLRVSAPDEPEAEGEWLLTSVRHEATQALETGAGGGGGNTYHCSFRAWPAGRPWRPARTTPVPRISGLVHAVIDGSPSAVYADPDDDGCYRVKPVYAADGAASMLVRLATPYAGEDHGLHLPLHAGTEVLIAHVDGDPDRPVIAAAVANPTHPSVVTSGNRSQCVLQSASGNRLMLDDAVGRELWETVAKRDRRARIGGDDDSSVRGNRTATVAGSETVAVQGDSSTVVGRSSSETVTAAKAVTVGGAMQVSVGGVLNHTVGGAMAEQIGAAKLSVVAGSSTTTIGNDSDLTVAGDQQETTTGKRQVRARKMRIAVQEEFAITCGKASIVLKKNGDIVIKGGAITIDGSGKVVVKGSKLAGN
jgi:type VI secretion system secreted protein VgrG